MKIAILGWGSLLWDKREEFEKHIGIWNEKNGPELEIEFSRISSSRDGALTLVVDEQNGTPCKVAFAFSKRTDPQEVICDLRCREGTTLANIGYYFRDSKKTNAKDGSKSHVSITTWAEESGVDVVVWTMLKSNFKDETKKEFSTDAAVEYVSSELGSEGKKKQIEYVRKAPDFVKTPLRTRLEQLPWFNI